MEALCAFSKFTVDLEAFVKRVVAIGTVAVLFSESSERLGLTHDRILV